MTRVVNNPDNRIIQVPSGSLVHFDEVGIEVACGRSEDGQPYVSVQTEGAPPSDVAEDSAPILVIWINDATLYDRAVR